MAIDKEAQAQLLAIRGVIYSLPAEDRTKVETCAQEIRDLMQRDDDFGKLAVALVGAEFAAEP